MPEKDPAMRPQGVVRGSRKETPDKPLAVNRCGVCLAVILTREV
jgi:hypothetical protein